MALGNGHPPDHLAWCRLIGAVKQTPHLAHVDGQTICRLVLTVDKAEFSIVARGETAQTAAIFAAADIVEIEGALTPHVLPSRDGQPRMVATVDAQKVSLLCHCKAQTL